MQRQQTRLVEKREGGGGHPMLNRHSRTSHADFGTTSHADFGAATHPGVGGGTHRRRATFERC